MGQLVHGPVGGVLAVWVEARCLEAAGSVVPDGTEDSDPCLEVGLDVFCEDVALEGCDGADGVHLEELVGTEVVPGEGKVILEEGAGGKGEEGILVDEGVGGRDGFGVDGGFCGGVKRRGQVEVGVFVVLVVAVLDAVEGGPGAEGGREDDGRDGALSGRLCVDEVAFCEEPELDELYL